YELRRQLLDLVTVRLPNGEGFRQAAKDRVIGCAFGVKLDFAKAALAKRALITFARSQALDQIDRRAKRQRHLLLPATDTQHRLRCALNHVENSGERFG